MTGSYKLSKYSTTDTNYCKFVNEWQINSKAAGIVKKVAFGADARSVDGTTDGSSISESSVWDRDQA